MGATHSSTTFNGRTVHVMDGILNGIAKNNGTSVRPNGTPTLTIAYTPPVANKRGTMLFLSPNGVQFFDVAVEKNYNEIIGGIDCILIRP
ncbi:MAG: hypothetical protein K6T85_16835 [Gorillibacterium sp.]|nr:hypothetical protein [Gorillibacterium sp.]